MMIESDSEMIMIIHGRPGCRMPHADHHQCRAYSVVLEACAAAAAGPPGAVASKSD